MLGGRPSSKYQLPLYTAKCIAIVFNVNMHLKLGAAHNCQHLIECNFDSLTSYMSNEDLT